MDRPVLQGKTAIVTGATSGMGRAIAGRFAREGAAVVLTGRHEERGRAVLREIVDEGGEGIFVPGDITDSEFNHELVRAGIREFGGIDILAACAGVLGLGSVTEVDIELWHRTMATNLHAVFYLLRFGIPALQARNGGSVIVIGSIAAQKGFPNHAAYCASKGALAAFIKQVAVDYAPEVRANLLAPGPVDTPLIWASAAAFPDPSRAVADVAGRTLLKRLGTPEDIADAATFLAGPDSKWITGSVITIDGGITCL